MFGTVAPEDTSALTRRVLLGNAYAAGFLLHHCITGTAEMVAGMATSSMIGPAEVGRFLLASTVGNAVGALIFAGLIRYSLAHPLDGK